MKAITPALGLVCLLAGAVPACAADPDAGRRPRKEPAYQSGSPAYCLLTFGPEEHRVWLVFDSVPDPLRPGDARDYLYVDRDGDGDLTGPGKRVEAKVHRVQEIVTFMRRPSYKTVLEFDVGEIREPGGKVRHTGLNVVVDWYMGKARPCFVTACARGEWAQYTEPRRLVFAPAPQDAPVIHFGGPLTMGFVPEPAVRFNDRAFDANGGYLDLPTLPLTGETELMTRIGTPGTGTGTFAALGAQCVPADVHPVAVIEFPNRDPDKPPLRTTVVLKKRCCTYCFHVTVRTPDGAGKGKAKVTLSFPDWKEGRVAPRTFEVPVGEAPTP
jgi:hypothetical protein